MALHSGFLSTRHKHSPFGSLSSPKAERSEQEKSLFGAPARTAPETFWRRKARKEGSGLCGRRPRLQVEPASGLGRWRLAEEPGRGAGVQGGAGVPGPGGVVWEGACRAAGPAPGRAFDTCAASTMAARASPEPCADRAQEPRTCSHFKK